MKLRRIDIWENSWSTVTAVSLGFMLVSASIMAEPFGIAVHIPNVTQLDLVTDLGADWTLRIERLSLS